RSIEVAGSRLTQTGGIVGTPEYMSPEQIAAPETVDARSDIYSLGVVLYEMLAGRPPFAGKQHEVLPRIVHEEPVPPRALRRGIPRALEAICLQCLEKNRAHRYASAADLADHLQRFLDNQLVPLPRLGWRYRAGAWVRRWRKTAALTAVLLLAV